jgi:hypothetical protein
MPRGPRLDAPDALHHVIARGIERCVIFEHDGDRHDFLDRLERVVEPTSNSEQSELRVCEKIAGPE